MKYFLAVLLVLLLALGATALVLTIGWKEETIPPPSPSISPQSLRREPLTPTLKLDGTILRPGFVERGQGAAPGELSGICGTAAIQEEGAMPDFSFSQQPDQLTAILLREDAEEGETPLFEGTLEQLAEMETPVNGSYLLDLQAVWNGAEEGFSGTVGYRIGLSYALPLRLTVDRQELPQGYFFLLRASNLPEGVEEVTAVTDIEFTPTFYPYQGEMIALMPARYNRNAGEYHITLTAGEESRDFTIQVTDGGFAVSVQQFEVDPEIANSTVNSPEANAVYTQVTRPLKQMGDPEKYWDGPFILPLDPKYKTSSSTFGRIRIINGVWEQHAGIDYPAPEGTQVWAPNNGRVLYAGFLQLTGNTICIEHGFGLKSWYYHLSAVEVEAGQMVKTGDPIGKVGTTGFSTGPHLHFTMSINNVYVNPEQCLGENILGE